MVNGQLLDADAILANADLSYVYQKFGQAERTAHKQYSCSVISFFWGMDKTYETFAPHTLFLADDYRENFDSIIRNLNLPTNPSCVILGDFRPDIQHSRYRNLGFHLLA